MTKSNAKSNLNPKQYKRQETFDGLMSDMVGSHGERVWDVMNSYIHSPLITKKIETKNKAQKRSKKSKPPKTMFTIKEIMKEIEDSSQIDDY